MSLGSEPAALPVAVGGLPTVLCFIISASALACSSGPDLTPGEQTAIAQMERALDAARKAEERFFAEAGYYTTDPERVEIGQVPGSTRLILEYATLDSYLVRAVHPDTDWTCFIVQPPNRPYYTRCVTAEEAPQIEADTLRLAPAQRPG